jgi:polypeptide N-acetylgalactosaminyltransferase
MNWIPRRHRSLVYKLLVLIPVAWLTIAFLLYNGKENALVNVNNNNNNNNIINNNNNNNNDNDVTQQHDIGEEVIIPAAQVQKEGEVDRWKDDPERHQEGVVPPPRDPNALGEMGKAVKFDNPEPAVKKLIDSGWQANAFNQYASDLISLHRSLPDPRDEWYVLTCNNTE